MVHHPVGIRSLAVNFPSIIRTNDYYREKYPEIIARSEQKSLARFFSLADFNPSNEFDLEMLPYLKDPFRGTVERRVLGPGESPLTLEYRVACDALDAAKLSPQDIDLMIVTSILPEKPGVGNSAFLARELGLVGAAWNLDATCASMPIALQTACALVRAGEYHNVLVVISCSYSRFTDEKDTLSWFLGDGSGACVVGSLEPNQGLLGTKTFHADGLCDIVTPKFTKDAQGSPQLHMKLCNQANKVTRETAVEFLRTCCGEAIASAGVTKEQIDFFVFNTATAWFASFAMRVLGIDPERTINLYPQYANIGPVLSLANLYYAAQLGKIRENDLVLVYSFGAAGAVSANVMRWGKVALGSDPKNKPDSVEKSSFDSSLTFSRNQ